MDIALNHRPAAIELQCAAAHRIVLDSGRRLKSCRLEAEVQAPETCEEANCLEHPTPPANRLRNNK